MFNMGWAEIIVILVVALVIFGPGKLPDIGKSLGKTIREFKSAVNKVDVDIKKEMDDIKEAVNIKDVLDDKPKAEPTPATSTAPQANASAETIETTETIKTIEMIQDVKETPVVAQETVKQP